MRSRPTAATHPYHRQKHRRQKTRYFTVLWPFVPRNLGDYSSFSSSDISPALPPAAVVSTESVRSQAKRLR